MVIGFNYVGSDGLIAVKPLKNVNILGTKKINTEQEEMKTH